MSSIRLAIIFNDEGPWIYLLFATKHSKYFSGAKALFTGSSRAAHWSKRQACKRPPERTGSLEEHWAPKHELFLKRSSSWSLGRRSQQAGRQAEVGSCLLAEEGDVYTEQVKRWTTDKSRCEAALRENSGGTYSDSQEKKRDVKASWIST